MKNNIDTNDIITFLEAVNQIAPRLNESYFYKNSYDFLLQEGKPFDSTPLTKEELQIIQNAKKAMFNKPQPKHCYHNSFLLTIADKTNTIKFTEGYATTNIPLPIEHAWNTINNKIIDLTWKDKQKKDILGILPENFTYFGVIIPTDYLLQTIEKTKWSGSMILNHHTKYELLKEKFNPKNI